MMAQLDDGLDSVISALQRTEMMEETYLLLSTDNGGHPVGGGFIYPFRGHKVESWEGAVRGRAVLRFPGGRFAAEFKGLVHIAE